MTTSPWQGPYDNVPMARSPRQGPYDKGPSGKVPVARSV
eukprot:CAMPEP_0184246468 /NCGR_PEP_ID=MMETSP0977-20130417/2008_1 /TAXON_ID=483370 /ORGANISM="non described non described, Strain CCMP2097" /LENGTH=38 /DNA_ID= /DNA_START= /DNA_END= /DNA_ORIENTATION=